MQGIAGTSVSRRRGSLAPALAVVVGLQLCLYLGLRLPEWLGYAGWKPPALPGEAQRATARWRRTVYDPRSDPAAGMPLAAFSLRSLKGGERPLWTGKGRWTALLVAGDGAG